MKKIALALIFILCFSFTAEAGTRSALRDKVRSLMNEPSGSSNYSDADINDGLNYAIDFLSNSLSDSYQHRAITRVTGTLTTAENSLSLPTSFKKIISVKAYNKQATFLKLDQFFNKENYMSVNDPHYGIYNYKIYIYPAGSISYDLFYMKRPTLMSSDSDVTPDIWDIEIDRVMVLIAAGYILKIDNQQNKAKVFEETAAQYITAINNSYTNTNTPEPIKAGEKTK